MKVLGIETSCDETAASVVKDGTKLLSNVVASSMDLHAKYGGVVPEIAARSHIEAINPVIEQALDDAACDWQDIDAIAVTYGAGLGGSLLIGVLAARTLAIVKNKPLYAINHVEAHLYANFLTEASATLSTIYHLPPTTPTFPMLGLIVSGGHSQLVYFHDHFDYQLLGRTQDDAIGEAFDKVAKILGLPYPGGPAVAKVAEAGDPHKYALPKAKLGPRTRVQHSDEVQGSNEQRKVSYTEVRQPISAADDATIRAVVESGRYDFSFSGLKTAVLRLAQQQVGEDYTFPSHKLPERLNEAQKADIAASFQYVAIETIVDKTIRAYEEFQPKSVVIGGGVSANQELRRQLNDRLPIKVEYPDIKLCTDNGAMVATLGCYKASLGAKPADPYTLDIAPNLTMSNL